MTDAIQKAKSKNPYIDWRNRPYASNPGAEQKRKEAAAFEALNEFVRRHGGFVTSPPGKTLRIEIAKDASAKLTNELTRLGYRVMACGTTTRIVGAQALSHKAERLTGTPSAFAEMDVLEIRLDGR